jgi:hypothetical protein
LLVAASVGFEKSKASHYACRPRNVRSKRLTPKADQQSGDHRQGGRHMEIITVQPTENIARCTLKTFVDRGRLTSIFF